MTNLGDWFIERRIERVVHQMDLPTANGHDVYLACAGSGFLAERGYHGSQQRFDCFRVDRTADWQEQVMLPDDWFCGAAVHDADGNIVTVGGTSEYPANNPRVNAWGGSKHTYMYHRDSGDISQLGDMAVGRWYPNLAKDQDSDLYVYGGQHDGVQQRSWEVMSAGADNWQPYSIPSVIKPMNSYKDLQLIAPDVFAYTGITAATAKTEPFIYNMATGTVTTTPGLRDAVELRRYSGGLLTYPAQDRDVYVAGGASLNGSSSTAKMDMIDYSVWPQQVPRFVPKASLPQAMMFVLMVNLPNGQMFATGGSRVWRNQDVLWAGFYDRVTDQWTLVDPPTIGRDYHGSIRVNLDGSVSVFGGNPKKYVFHDEVETYRPWYMSVPRPGIQTDTLEREMTKGWQYRVDVDLPAGSTLGDFTLDSARASTHTSSDPGQAMFGVPFTPNGDGSATLTVPNDILLTPGWYKLTAVTSDEVPSESHWVHVS